MNEPSSHNGPVLIAKTHPLYLEVSDERMRGVIGQYFWDRTCQPADPDRVEKLLPQVRAKLDTCDTPILRDADITLSIREALASVLTRIELEEFLERQGHKAAGEAENTAK